MEAIRLRVRGPSGGAALNLPAGSLLGELKRAIGAELGIPEAQQRLRAGFPPQVLEGADAATLQSLGIANGESLMVEDAGPGAAAAALASPAVTAPAAAELAAPVESAAAQLFQVGERVIYRGGDGVPHRVKVAQYSSNVPAGEEPMVAVRLPDGTIRDTLLSRLFRDGDDVPAAGGGGGDSAGQAADAAAAAQLCSMGFGAEQAAEALRLVDGDVERAMQVLLGELDPASLAPAPPTPAPAAPVVAAAAAAAAAPATAAAGVAVPSMGGELHRRAVPADNSCLFNAVGYLCQGDRELSSGPPLRRLVAEAVLAAPERYSSAFLDKPPAEYAAWIQSAEHWGGAIELMILAEHFRAVLSCVCIQTGRVDHYGQGQGYSSRGLLVYDGIHYDPLALQLAGVGAQQHGAEAEAEAARKAVRAMDVTLFAVDEQSVLQAAQALGKAAQEKRQFTDAASFTLRCLVCQQGLTGQEQAIAHATATGHQNFSQY
eukprot:SAG11_NODE_1205_length_5529_cov_6.569797_1_plen_488_part_00